MKRISFLCAFMILLGTLTANAQDFEAWMGTWDVEMYYQLIPLEDRMVWIIDNATDSAAYGTDEISGADIIITWDEANKKYVFGTFMITMSGNSFQGYLTDFKEITLKGKKRPPDDGNGGGDNGPDGSCPVMMVLSNNAQAIDLLQRFRDEVLAPTPTGRLLISLYYRHGKFLCDMLQASSELQQACRIALLSILPLIEQTYGGRAASSF